MRLVQALVITSIYKRWDVFTHPNLNCNGGIGLAELLLKLGYNYIPLKAMGEYYFAHALIFAKFFEGMDGNYVCSKYYLTSAIVNTFEHFFALYALFKA